LNISGGLVAVEAVEPTGRAFIFAAAKHAAHLVRITESWRTVRYRGDISLPRLKVLPLALGVPHTGGGGVSAVSHDAPPYTDALGTCWMAASRSVRLIRIPRVPASR